MKPYFSFQWHITDTCDQRCKHCYIFSRRKEDLDEMSYENMLNTLDKCFEFCDHFDRIPYFFITGGDPILHPYFWDLLELLKEKDIGFSILGNPFHLTEKNCTRLKELGCDFYQLSLDGLEKTHDWFRKPGSFNKTLEVIPIIQNTGIDVNIMSTISGINKDELLDLIDCVVENNVDTFSFSRYCPGEKNEDNGLDPFEYRDLLKSCKKKFKEYENQEVTTYFDKKDHLWTLLDFEEKDFVIPDNIDSDLIYSGCNCGNAHLTILPSGDIYACRRVKDSKVGNVLEDSIIDVWLGKMEEYREFTNFEKCNKCELLAWCRGCPAVSSASEKGFYAEDPQCWKVV